MRKIFINQLVKAATKNKKIILIVGDLGYGIVEPFKKNFPIGFLMLVLQNRVWLD